jgi:hypothetical protein
MLRYLYTLSVSLDGNFKLKQKNRDIQDLELGSGLAHFVHRPTYAAYVSENPESNDEPEVRVS